MNGGNERGKPTSQKPPTAVMRAKQSIKRQLHTTHVAAVGWEPRRSSPTRSGEGDARRRRIKGLVYVYPLL